MKKILYFINQNFGHYLFAKSIQDKINAEIFAIYDVTNKPRQFFENQKIVNFENPESSYYGCSDVKKRVKLIKSNILNERNSS